MGGLPNRRVVHVEVVADGPYDHLPRVYPYTDLEGDALGPLDLHSILLYRGLHGQGSITGPHRMIFMGYGRPEQRHDPIAHDLVHGPLIAMDRRHHAFQDRIEELPSLLRVAVGEEFHGAFEIGKQHGHLLALAFEGAFGRQDLLGEIGRSVGEWEPV